MFNLHVITSINPCMLEVLKKKFIMDKGDIVYAISDNSYICLVHMVPKEN